MQKEARMKIYAIKYSEIGYGNAGYISKFYATRVAAEGHAHYLNEHDEDFEYGVVEVELIGG